jgi:hypothetical protein
VSANAGVAWVAGDGVVTATGPGTTQVTVRSGRASASVVVTVTAPPPPAVAATATPAPPRLTTIRVAPGTVSLSPGTSVQLMASAIDQNGRLMPGAPMRWSSDADAVATVSSAGVVRAVTAGTARITARGGSRSGTAEVSVTPVAVATVEIAPTRTSIVVGGSAQFTATARDGAGSPLANRAIAWRPGNPSVASVSPSGLVTGLAAGTTTISATSGEATASATVTVEAPAAPAPVADPQVEIRAVLEEYRTAIESVDIARLKRMYPDMSAEQERGWRILFNDASDLRATFRILDPQVDGDAARARVEATYHYRTDRAPLTDIFTARLERGARGWRLVAIN